MEDIYCPNCGQKKIEFMSKCTCGFDYSSIDTHKQTDDEIKNTNKKQKQLIISFFIALFLSILTFVLCSLFGIKANTSKLIAIGVFVTGFSANKFFSNKD